MWERRIFFIRAEGATTPESLRQMDRKGKQLWKEGSRFDAYLTEGESRFRVVRRAPVILSGSKTERGGDSRRLDALLMPYLLEVFCECTVKPYPFV